MRKKVIKTQYGDVCGELSEGVLYCSGIPYGRAGIERRFLPPLAPKPWQGVLDCTHFADKAIQSIGVNRDTASVNPVLARAVMQLTGGNIRLLTAHEGQSEECLNLHVVAPEAEGKGRPVLVYVHGGGFQSGGGMGVLAGGKLCAEEDVVLVGMNERLNLFGYLYLGALDEDYVLSGMSGILDIVLALEWVRDNIAVFGGDANNVTLIGESGGAMKISHLLALERAVGLFHRAILMSGAAPVGTCSREVASQFTERLMRVCGIEKRSWDKLLSMPARVLFDAYNSPSVMGADALGLIPVADGKELLDNPEGEWRTYEWSRNIPVIVGASEDEVGMGFSQFEMTWEEVRQKLSLGGMTFFGHSFALAEENATEVLESFRAENVKGDAPWHTYIKILSSMSLLGAGAYRFARARTKAGGRVYLYYTSFDNDMGVGNYRCSWHTADLMPAFRAAIDERNEQFSKVMAGQFAQFMRSGVPGGEWKPFDASVRMMIYDEESRFAADPMPCSRALIEGLGRGKTL